ncbi:MAG: hotdog fold domain-containing protein [Pseudomonadota bacterium]
MSQFLAMYNKLGAEKFSAAVPTIAPYFGTIEAQFVDLRPGHAEICVRNQPKVHNHIATVHAIALCNGAELVAGTCTDASIPAGARWLPTAMSVQYLAKAKTDIRVLTEATGVDWAVAGDIDVPIAAYDTDGTKVFSAVITMNVKHAPVPA